jgi:hypothetical protein
MTPKTRIHLTLAWLALLNARVTLEGMKRR